MKVRNLIDYLEKFAAGEEVRAIIQNAEGIGDMDVEPADDPLLMNPDLEENVPYLEIQPSEELEEILNVYFRDAAMKMKEDESV